MGNEPVDLETIRRSLLDRANDDPKTILAHLQIAVRAPAASVENNGTGFFGDKRLEAHVTRGTSHTRTPAFHLSLDDFSRVHRKLVLRPFFPADVQFLHKETILCQLQSRLSARLSEMV